MLDLPKITWVCAYCGVVEEATIDKPDKQPALPGGWEYHRVSYNIHKHVKDLNVLACFCSAAHKHEFEETAREALNQARLEAELTMQRVFHEEFDKAREAARSAVDRLADLVEVEEDADAAEVQ